MGSAKNYRVATRKKGSANASGVRVPGKGHASWDIGKTAMTASNARSVARQLGTVYPDYEYCAVKVDKEGNPL